MNRVSSDGLGYYKNLTRELIANGIEPIVTIYHFDHPRMLEDMGGWTNELMVDWFVDYARIIFRELGPMVKIFATINEPQHVCRGYQEPHIMSPGEYLSLLKSASYTLIVILFYFSQKTARRWYLPLLSQHIESPRKDLSYVQRRI